jgi:hypothetical protein
MVEKTEKRGNLARFSQKMREMDQNISPIEMRMAFCRKFDFTNW